jgi:hypothetical protein
MAKASKRADSESAAAAWMTPTTDEGWEEVAEGMPTRDPVVPAGVDELVRAVSDAIVPAARAAGSSKFGVEFGVRVVKGGSPRLTQDAGKATFRVFLEWTGEGGQRS